MERKRSVINKFIAFFVVMVLPHCLLGQQYQIGQRSFNRNVTPITWTFIQNVANFSCSSGATSCVISGIASTTANSVLAIGVDIPNATAQHITSASGGGGTWSLCPTASCAVFNSNFTPHLSADMVYNITGTGGATSITVNLSAATSGAWQAEVGEWKRSTGVPTLDVISGSNSSLTSCTVCTASSFPTLHGSTDLLVQYLLYNGASPSAISSPYQLSTQDDFIYALSGGTTASPTASFGSATPFVSTGITFF